MRKAVVVLCVAALAVPALAQLVPGSHYKMHFPQPPDELGWDVNATFPLVLADDWQCTESGPVDDIHFWGSWRNGLPGVITSFIVSIHADIPDPDDEGPLFSMPGELLWEQEILVWEQQEIVPVDPPALEGWYDPSIGLVLPDDHAAYFQYDITGIVDPFEQTKGTIYWLNITANVAGPEQWGWKSSSKHWNDDAVWLVDPPATWEDLFEPPDFVQSLDLAFAITGDPDDVPAVSAWGVVVMVVVVLSVATVVIRGRRLRKAAA